MRVRWISIAFLFVLIAGFGAFAGETGGPARTDVAQRTRRIVPWSPPSEPGTPEGRFGATFRRELGGIRVAPREEYNSRPLTVECWARLRGSANFNILVANEPKASQTHWEIYSYAGTGNFSAYLPGNDPAEVQSGACITDGEWHYLAMVLEEDRLRLFVDGENVANVPVRRPEEPETVAGPLAFGALAEGGLGCDGLVDEVRISSNARTVGSVPRKPFEADSGTVGLWHFDENGDDEVFADASALRNAAPRLDALPPRNRPRASLAPMSPEPDLPALRESLNATVRRLDNPAVAEAARVRDAVLAEWDEQYYHIDNRLHGRETLPEGAAQQVLDREALVFEEDGDPLGVVLRRTGALLEHLGRVPSGPDLSDEGRSLSVLRKAALEAPLENMAARRGLFLAACALRRRIALANPLLDFDEMLFVARGNYQGSRLTGPRTTADIWGQHFATQYFGFNSIPGGGLYVVSDYKTTPRVRDVVERSVVENGRLQGRMLDEGAFLAPDLSYDGETILFSWTENREHEYVWSRQTSFNIFRVNVDGSNLTQLTDTECDDFDACWLPNGRIVFISERRGGYIRCFGPAFKVPNHVMHSMKSDGSDAYPISWFETSEWHPSVNNDGMIVYTRWDYVDRENCLGSNFWICYPDGRDPRAPHGNYPYPWHTFEDNPYPYDGRIGRPYTEMNIRAIPGSHRYITTAAPHHGESFGSLVMLDLRERDDAFMSQIRRITPYPPFPESECVARGQYPYGTPWALSEDFYLCNWWENIYLLDRFGNRVLLCENRLVFGETNYDMRLIDPIPLRPRARPPIIPTQTNQGEDARPDAPKATISVLNVYETDQPFPPETRIRWLRVLQVIPKSNHPLGEPPIGYHWENTPRIPLGIVPVEEDGSAYFEAPVERELMFQVLDENFMAVQSMRSITYVHRGEPLTCIGCHEDVHRTPERPLKPLAYERAPSKLAAEAGAVEPLTFYRLVKPVFERTCLPCHNRQGKGPADMSYEALEPYVSYHAGGMRGSVMMPVHGGSRTIPGRFGARNSRMGKALLNETHRRNVPEEDYRRVVLWLDANALRYGAFHGVEEQEQGALVWPLLDVDPDNPQGLER